MTPKILFLLKHREQGWNYGGNEPATGSELSSGLKNSVTFLVDALREEGIDAQVRQLRDNNCIDRALAEVRPNLCILEAFWVVPDKLDVLKKLHPTVHWAVRNHSNVPFLSNEGIATEWLHGYLSRGVEIMSNDPRAVHDTKAIARSYRFDEELCTYAPNVYPIREYPRKLLAKHHKPDDLNIGCFGAIRPLKNVLTQAVAAIQFAQQMGKKLKFHINSTRIEQVGEPIIRNIRNLFAHAKRAELVCHPWMEHDAFLRVVAQMDYELAVSFSETFCICAADSVSQGVPVVGSAEIPWLGKYAICDPSSSQSIVSNLISANQQSRHDIENNRLLWQWRDLHAYSRASRHIWMERFGIE